MDELPRVTVESEVALDACEPLVPRCERRDEPQLPQHPCKPLCIGPVHQEVDVACAGRPTMPLPMSLPLTIPDTLALQRCTELPHEGQRLGRRRSGGRTRRSLRSPQLGNQLENLREH